MPVPELPQALSKKVVDGALIPWEIIAALNLQNLTDYQIELAGMGRLGTTTFQVSMNQARWDSLPDDLKKAFTDNSGAEWLKEVGTIWREIDNAGIAVATKAGNKHIILTDAETAAFKAKLEPVVDRWVKDVTAQGIDGKKLVEAARAAMAKHSTAK
jgi:TRAP-type C4-dicarboxylate transport system substrate-binding protein